MENEICNSFFDVMMKSPRVLGGSVTYISEPSRYSFMPIHHTITEQI